MSATVADIPRRSDWEAPLVLAGLLVMMASILLSGGMILAIGGGVASVDGGDPGASDCSDSIYYDSGLDLYFPDASCTGVLPGVSRSASGSITTSSNGQTIENLDVSGTITINHNDVTVRNVKITNPNGVAISNFNGGTPVTGTLIENVEMDGTGNTTGASAIDFWNYTLRYSYIHDYGEGPGCAQNVLIEWNYMDDFGDFVSGGAHQDGIQCEFGSNGIVRNNTIIIDVDGGNSAILFGGDSSDMVAEYNLVGGTDASYAMRMGQFGGTYRFNRVLSGHPPFFGEIEVIGGSSFSPTPCNNVWFDGPDMGDAVSGGGSATC